MRGPAGTWRGGVSMAGGRKAKTQGRGMGPSLVITAMFSGLFEI